MYIVLILVCTLLAMVIGLTVFNTIRFEQERSGTHRPYDTLPRMVNAVYSVMPDLSKISLDTNFFAVTTGSQRGIYFKDGRSKSAVYVDYPPGMEVQVGGVDVYTGTNATFSSDMTMTTLDVHPIPRNMSKGTQRTALRSVPLTCNKPTHTWVLPNVTNKYHLSTGRYQGSLGGKRVVNGVEAPTFNQIYRTFTLNYPPTDDQTPFVALYRFDPVLMEEAIDHLIEWEVFGVNFPGYLRDSKYCIMVDVVDLTYEWAKSFLTDDVVLLFNVRVKGFRKPTHEEYVNYPSVILYPIPDAESEAWFNTTDHNGFRSKLFHIDNSPNDYRTPEDRVFQLSLTVGMYKGYTPTLID